MIDGKNKRRHMFSLPAEKPSQRARRYDNYQKKDRPTSLEQLHKEIEKQGSKRPIWR